MIGTLVLLVRVLTAYHILESTCFEKNRSAKKICLVEYEIKDELAVRQLKPIHVEIPSINSPMSAALQEVPGNY